LENKLKCLMCGRVFYEGQGVTLDIAGRRLTFHSKSCAIKFVRLFFEHGDYDCLRSSLNKVLKIIEERNKRLQELRTKKI